MHFVLALLGAVLGAMTGIYGGFIVGGLLGFLGGMVWQQSSRLQAIERRLDALGAAPPAELPDSSEPAAETHTEGPVASEEAPPPPVSAPTPARLEAEPSPAIAPAAEAPDSGEAGVRVPALGNRIAEAFVRFLTTGNPVVRIGAVVLFIGVAFLLRYAYEHALVPVELRLAGAGLGGIVLLAVGWRLRARSDTYGLILQAVGIAILYLTVFAAARLYSLLPLGAAFPILVALVAGACVLAVVQKSQALAIFSMAGGFLAPVLTSTGEGSHVALFSYYAVLNAGILGMAWFRHWRWLNWTGFVFTFVIGSAWGYQYYQPDYYATTQPFLILFFLFYLGVSMLFARRQEVELKGVVDGTLVFGTPVIAFMLQAGLVRDMEFGLAFSALGAAIVYTGLALWLKRQQRISELLDESFVALAVVFATLAIPFAFDNQRFTAAAWALEGAGIVWIGLRQGQLLPRVFGYLLQLAAGLAFVSEIGRSVDATPFLNSAYLGTAFLGLGGILTAAFVHDAKQRRVDAIGSLEGHGRWVCLGWGVIWWLAGGLRELGLHTPGEPRFASTNLGEHFFLIYVALSVLVLSLIAQRRKWQDGLVPGFLLLPIAVVVLVNLDLNWVQGTAFTDYGWLAWPLTFAIVYWHLRRMDEVAAASIWHALGWWFAVLFVTWNLAAWVDTVFEGSVWTYVLWGGVPLACLAALRLLDGSAHWPFDRFPRSYFGWGWTVGLGYLIVWLLATGSVEADPAPIPYVVLLNPVELVQAGILVLGGFWLRRFKPEGTPDALRAAWLAVGGAAFAWVNFVAMRAVHFYGGVPYPVERIFESDAFQSTATILWTIIALILMGAGARRSVRLSWLVGAGLLAVVILKLFFVDMGSLDMVARIVSFITVGILMLVIGYFAPLPPKRAAAES